MKLKKRNEIEEKYKWNLDGYFESESEFELAYQEFARLMPKVLKFSGNLQTHDDILNCLDLLSALNEKFEAIYVYSNIKRDEDVSIGESQVRFNKATSIANAYRIATSFIPPQLSMLSDEFLLSLKQSPDFSEYTKFIDDILKEKPHLLSENEEMIMSQISNFTGEFKLNFSNFDNGDLKFQPVKDGTGKYVPLSQSSASVYFNSPDAVLRKNTYKELNGAFGRFNNFLTSNFMGSVKKDNFISKVRKFDNSLQSALFYEDISEEVYKTLIESVNQNLGLEHRYFELKRKILGLKKISVADMRISICKNYKRKFTYEEGFEIIKKAISKLGNHYVETVDNFYKNRQIDVMPNQNKYTGGYMTSAYKKYPVILINFNGTFSEVSTLAHELGHAMHSYLSDKNQPIYKASYTLFLAEIASTVNECLLNRYMLEHAKNKQEKIYFLNEFISTFHATVFRQTMFSEFEVLVHKMQEQGADLSSEIINQLYYDIAKKYFGNKVELLDEIKYEWSRIPHFYSAFYVYKYATGLISALAIVDKILKEGQSAVDKYIKFLSSGCSIDSLSTLKLVDIDLTDKKTFDSAFKYIEDYINQLEQLTKEESI